MEAGADYQETSKQVSLLNEDQKFEVQQFIGIKPKIDLQARFSFVEMENGQEKQISNTGALDVKAILLPEEQNAKFQELELEEYEYDVLFDESKGFWASTLPNGTYLLTVKSNIYKEINEVFSIKAGAECDFIHQVSSVKIEIPQIEVLVVDPMRGKPVQNVLIELFKEGFQNPDEGLSDSQGFFKFGVKKLGTHRIQVSKDGFITYSKILNMGKGFMQASAQGDVFAVTVPIIPTMVFESAEDKVFAVLSNDG